MHGLQMPEGQADFGFWSGRRGSNSRHSAWKAEALPTELLPRTPDTLALPDACPPPGGMTPARFLSLTEIHAISGVVVKAIPRPQRRNLLHRAYLKGWWWGEDLNLRRHRRQIYSLFPLTTREPHRFAVISVTENDGSAPWRPESRPPSPNAFPEGWSQRQESNPRPADYKSAALPAELLWPRRLPKPAARGKGSTGPATVLPPGKLKT